VIALAVGGPGAATAQTGVFREGAIFLLLPLGARIVASGQSVASPDASAEQLYWNPSGIARATKREMALNTGRFYVAPLLSVASVIPLGRAGVVGASASVLNYGTQETGDQNGATGVLTQHAYVFAAAYAATLGTHASLGFAFKSAQSVSSCAGLCGPLAVYHVSSSAVDVGVQYRMFKDDDLVLGFALRHAGLRFQVNDEPQADPLPTRVQLGANLRVRWFDDDLPGSRLRVSADLIDRAPHLGSAAPRFGVELAWRDQIGARAGYVVGSGEGTGVGVGIGVATLHAAFDISQTLGGLGDAATSATYLTMRYRW
jgi:hypothetical protein